MKKILLILSLSLTALISFGQCDTEASFEFELIDGVYHFTNTSTGEDDAPLYEWTVDGTVWSDAENPTLGEGDIVDGTVICLEVSDEETACVDEVCVTFEVDEEPCEVTADFEYEVIDGVYHFTNTSVGEGDTPIFEWTVDGTIWSDAENPTLGGGDVEDGTIICLTVSTGDGDLDCSDEICIEIVEEEDPCDLDVSFEFDLIDGTYHFENTSTGELFGSNYEWTVDGVVWSDDENPTLGEGDVEPGTVICLEITTWSEDEEIICEDEYCFEFEGEDPCDLDVSFEFDLIDGTYHFENTSTGELFGSNYEWTVDGVVWSDDENPTLGEGDVEPGTVICLEITTWSEDEEIICEDEYCFEFEGEDPCELDVNFEFDLIDGTYHFENTSSGELFGSNYEWTVDGVVWSDDENPTLGEGDVEPGTVICLEITTWSEDEEIICEDEYCFEFEGEDPCELTANFEYELIDGVYHFYNTSTGEWDETTYQWSVDGDVWSDAENPTLGEGDIEPGTVICLLVITLDGEIECASDICMIIEGEDPCELEASFEYELIDGVYHFYNTSTGEWVGTTYLWTVNGDDWSDDENPTLGEGDVEPGTEICLHVTTYDGELECTDEVCIEIGEDGPCELEAGFEYEIIEGAYHFYNTSSGEMDETFYHWSVGGVVWSEAENPTLGLEDAGPGTEICLLVNTNDDINECEDDICMEIAEDVGINTDNKPVLSIYPNPVRDVVTIQLADNVQIQQIEIYNTIGELVAVLPNASSSQNITVDLSELESGIYFIQLLNESGAYSNPQQIVKY